MPKQSGQSLIEVLIALTLAGLVVVALVILVLSGLKNAQFAQNQAKATKYAQEVLEQIKTTRDRDEVISFSELVAPNNKFSDLFGVNMSALCTNPAGSCFFQITNTSPYLRQVFYPSLDQDLGDGLSRQIIFTDKNTGTPPSYQIEKTITVKVKWTDSSGDHESNLQTILTKH